MIQIEELLAQLTQAKASDLHLKVGSFPFLRVNGHLEQTSLDALLPADTESLAKELLPPERAAELAETGETDFALGIPGVGRFRVSALRQRGTVALVLRRVLTNPPSIDALGLPPVLRQLAARPSGLVLVVGPGDAGKTTTVAAMLDEVNKSRPMNIVTIEDPIEILHADKVGFVLQREVGGDTLNHLDGLRRSLRHDADVLYVDAIPNQAVMEEILSAATARLVFAVMPSLGALDAVQRLVNFFPPQLERQARRQVASVLQGVLSQRLLPRSDDRGRVAAFEVLVITPRVQENILGITGSQDIEELMRFGDYYGMQTLDQHLVRLYREGAITLDTAMATATNAQEMRVELQQGDLS